jgi:choline dehydrogenase
MTQACAQKLIIEGGRVTGVEYLQRSTKGRVDATSEVILSAGAIQSPQLLQLSGGGPGELLTKHGIPVVVDRPAVGGNLQDHYQMRTTVKLRQNKSLNIDVRNPLKLMQMGLDWALRGRGALTIGAGQVGGAARTKHAPNDQPDVQFNVMPLSIDKPGEPLRRYPGFTAAVWQCHPESRGRVDIASTDPSGDPKISPNYLSTSLDQKTLVEGVRILREIYHQPAFEQLWSDEVVPGSDVSSDADILASARSMGGTVFHCVGTCRMGGDKDAVVGLDLKVRGIDGLRVLVPPAGRLCDDNCDRTANDGSSKIAFAAMSVGLAKPPSCL